MNVGDVVGSYKITRVLGGGGMGVVYLGTHTLLGREAAIKVLLPSLSSKQDVVQRFFNEAKTASSIKHPGIVEIYDFGYSEEKHAFIVMERLEGETLDGRIRRLGKLPAGQALSLLAQIARALGAAHDLEVVHRDLKPENIYIVADPEVPGGERAKILDFGIAKLRNASSAGVRTASGQVMGPPGYMAPEQCLGASEVDHRADIYALGCILFDMVCGRPPFEATAFADVLAAHVSKEPPVPSSLEPSLGSDVDGLVASLLAKDPDERPQSTVELVERIEAAAAKAAAPRKPAGRSSPPPIPKPDKRRTQRGPAPGSMPPPIPTAAKKKPPAKPSPRPKPTSRPPPRKPARENNIEIDPDLLDSAAPLPPLPRPRPQAPPGPPPPQEMPPQGPVPRAPANAPTLYTGASEPVAEPPRRERPQDLKDLGLAQTMTPEQAQQLGFGPGLAGPARQPGPASHQELGLAATLRPTPRPAQPPAPEPPPAADWNLPKTVASQPQPMAPQAPPPQQPQPMAPQPMAPQPMAPQPMAPQPRAPTPPPLSPLSPLAPQPDPPRPQPAGKLEPLRQAPPQAPRAYQPPYEPGRRSRAPLFIALLLLLGAGSVGGFFVYREMTSGEASAATDAIDAGTAAAADAKAVASAADAAAAAPTPDAKAVAAATDAAVARPPDAAVAAAPPDAAVVAHQKPDAGAAKVASSEGGKVLDPALATFEGDDAVETVSLRIDSRPRGAKITRKHDHLVLGTTPIEYVTRKFNANEEFVIELAGHYPVTIKMSTNRAGARLVPLLAKPKP